MKYPLLMSIEWTASPWWMVAVLLLAGLGALHLYYRWSKVQDAKPWQRFVLAAARFLTILGLGFLLLGPRIKRVTSSQERKYVPILIDNSRSISNAHPDAERTILAPLQGLSEDISDVADAPIYYFDRRLSKDVDSPFVASATNISASLKRVREDIPEERIAGIILVSDGIYTEGRNPQYMTNLASTPVYTVGLGDTTADLDLAIIDVLHNPVVYKGDAFEVEVDLRAKDLNGKNITTEILRRDGNQWVKLSTKRDRVDSDDFFKVARAVIKADRPGLIRYRARTTYDETDAYPNNNYRDFYVEVIASRQKILLYAQAPHPDLQALSAAWTSMKNYEVDIAYAKEGISPRWSTYDLVVLHQLPSTRSGSVQELVATLDRLKKPRWYIAGSQTNFTELNRVQRLVSVEGEAQQTNDVLPKLNTGFSYFKTNAASGDLLKDAPPMTVPFGTFKAHPTSQVLWYQTINGIETDDPLMLLGEQDGIRQAVLLGEGLWKWRIFDFVQNDNHDLLDEAVQSVAQFLAVDATKKRFKITKPSTLFDQHQAVVLSASYFNESYELDNSRDVSLVLTAEDGTVSNFVFSKAGDTYQLNLGRLEPGRYSYVGKVDEKTKLADRGSFEVLEVDIEMQRLQANHQVLSTLASKSGGFHIGLHQLDQLRQHLQADASVKPAYVSQEARSPLLDLWWILPILLGLLTIEWFIRKYIGSY